ncbi:ankyrin repeat domain-containing protein [Bradyrhizobium sp. CIAT3101]|uniref:ankyrin repeat domain-containing protein n=1 Tax=Bradyrhizobium sp. CIAT3101 TaxID=439387 RepID=UPI0024B1A665|nr:ankyrin repeat domain-containing protein [Bradyrhizobium sp. CIAT3101]WFU79064.1 ankyrin repeat domain-containing protein [Bradyrhizobium sp. CIAT3101]
MMMSLLVEAHQLLAASLDVPTASAMSGKWSGRTEVVGKHPIDRAGRSPLHYAAANRAVAEVTRLVETGADPSAQDNNGWSPLHFAAQANSAEVTRVLIAAGAIIDPRDTNGNTPLGKAIFSSRGDGAVIKLLRDAGADPYAENSSGVTPLMLARTIANYDVAQFFGDLPGAQD